MPNEQPKWDALIEECKAAVGEAEKRIENLLSILAKGQNQEMFFERLQAYEEQFALVQERLLKIQDMEPEARRAWSPIRQKAHAALFSGPGPSVESLNEAVEALMKQIGRKKDNDSQQLGNIKQTRAIIQGWSPPQGPPKFIDHKG